MISNNSPIVVAMVQDLQNGSYKLQFVTSPSLPLTPLSGQGTINITLQYSCGLGCLEPPMKIDWSTGEAINNAFCTRCKMRRTAPSMPPFVAPGVWRGGF
jgi:hypothetical protein